jgi:hypothetical protein
MSKFTVSKLELRKRFLLLQTKFPISSSTTTQSGKSKSKSTKKSGGPMGAVPTAVKASKSKISKPSLFPVLSKSPPTTEKAAEKIIRKPELKKNKNKHNFANVDDQGLPCLNSKDCFRRVEFASKVLEIINCQPAVLDSIVFSDEGNFRLTQASKNRKIKPPGERREKPSHSTRRLTAESKPLPQIIWLGMSSKHIVGPYFFNSHVTGTGKNDKVPNYTLFSSHAL